MAPRGDVGRRWWARASKGEDDERGPAGDWLDPSAAPCWQLRTVVSSGCGHGIDGGSRSLLSSREAKEAVEPVDPLDVLAGVRELDVATWSYEFEDGSIRHMGPMAADFSAEFGLGADRDRIASIDADGVAFGAIQGLADQLDEQRRLIATQRETIETQRARLAAQEDELASQRDRLEACVVRLEALEADGATD